MKTLATETRKIYRRRALIAILLDILELLMNGGSEDEAISKLAAFVKDETMEKISVEDLCSALGVEYDYAKSTSFYLMLVKQYCLRYEANEKRNAQLRARLDAAEKLANAARNIPGAILAAEDAGCIDHLDAWDDADKLYRDKLFDLDSALQEWDALK